MNPTHRTSPGRKNRRRSHLAIRATATVLCPNCGEVKLPHCKCGSCGYVRPGLQLRNEEEEN